MDITERIINHLVMASSFTSDIGLYHGKDGNRYRPLPLCPFCAKATLVIRQKVKES